MRDDRRAGQDRLFATHYLEEADAYADRIVLIARGQIVADGPATEIKAQAAPRDDQGNAARRRPGGARRAPGVLER